MPKRFKRLQNTKKLVNPYENHLKFSLKAALVYGIIIPDLWYLHTEGFSRIL